MGERKKELAKLEADRKDAFAKAVAPTANCALLAQLPAGFDGEPGVAEEIAELQRKTSELMARSQSFAVAKAARAPPSPSKASESTEVLSKSARHLHQDACYGYRNANAGCPPNGALMSG